MARMISQQREIPYALNRARRMVGTLKKKREIAAYQAAVLFTLCKQLDHGSRVLEIGTALGFSAAIMALAANTSYIETINIRTDESQMARDRLCELSNVTVITADSHELVKEYNGPPYDLIFVDGDHDGVALDMPWFNHVKIGGLMLHHDYAPEGSARPCRAVYDCLNDWRASMGRDFDVWVVDLTDVGMVGYIRRDGESW